MKATSVLTQEHRVIKQVLACLAAAVDQARASGVLDADSVRKALRFFRLFADRCHHGKEEDRLFPLLQERGIGCLPGAISILLAEHEQGRSHVRAMDEALAAAERGDAAARTRLFQHAQQYMQLLSEHIRKEDECLFPTADAMLAANDQQALVDAFEEFEKREMGAGTHKELHALADELIAKWGIDAMGTGKERGCCDHS